MTLTLAAPVPSLDLDALLSAVARVAAAAGRLILAVRAGGCDARTKADGSPVTAADLVADVHIRAALTSLTPALPVVSEEALNAPAISQDLFWLADPLDGTKEFLAGDPDFTVNIALVADGVPVLGVVGAPALGLLFAGGPDGAWRRTGSGPREPVRVRAPSGPLTVFTSKRHGDGPALEAYLAGLDVGERIGLGSSLKICRVADGTGDLYPRLGPTHEWDTAAADAVLRAAGGAVRTLDGAPLRYGKPGWKNPPFVAAAG